MTLVVDQLGGALPFPEKAPASVGDRDARSQENRLTKLPWTDVRQLPRLPEGVSEYSALAEVVVGTKGTYAAKLIVYPGMAFLTLLLIRVDAPVAAPPGSPARRDSSCVAHRG